jgi:hypothetical protein
MGRELNPGYYFIYFYTLSYICIFKIEINPFSSKLLLNNQRLPHR